MEYGVQSLEKKLKESIKDYSIGSLFKMSEFQEYLKCVATMAKSDILLTERHGQKVLSIGDFREFIPDVVNKPGRKIKVFDRTVGHIYIKNHNERPDMAENAEEYLNALAVQLSVQAEEAYKYHVLEQYVEELDSRLGNLDEHSAVNHKEDALTGVFNKTYFENRMKVVDRSQIVPVAVICANINDWKYVNEKYGEEESDRLIKLIAGIIKKEAKPEYIIGRVDGDVFYILIPSVEDGEGEQYCKRIRESCLKVEDAKLAPSVACGIVIKYNVEQKISELKSDAEYSMFLDKLEQKSRPGYKERLEKI